VTAPDARLTGPAYADRYDDVRVSVEQVRLTPVTLKPDLLDFAAGRVLAFDKATLEAVTFNIQIPHAHKLGTLLYPHVHWAPIDTGTGVVRWGLTYALADIGSAFVGTTVYAEQAGGGVANVHQIADFTAIAGGAGVSAMLVCSLFRDAAHENDTYDNDAALLEFDIHILCDSIGSRQERIK
jgi:hypothetical protein